MMNMEMNSLENVLLATAASFFVVIVASAVGETPFVCCNNVR